MVMVEEIEQFEMLEAKDIELRIEKVQSDAGLGEDSAIALRNEFSGYYKDIVEFREKALMVTKPEDATHQRLARDVRLNIRKIRCEIENLRKKLKADSLARGKAIDGYANVLKYLCEPVEERLLAVEQYAERKEAARIEALVQERKTEIARLGADPSPYNLAVMDDESFQVLLESIRDMLERKIEAECKAEAERVAREAADRIAREKAEKEAAEARAQWAAERKAREEAEAKIQAEREAKEAMERELAEAKRKEEAKIAEQKAEEERKLLAEAEAKRKAATAPDKEKLVAFANSLQYLGWPEMSDLECKTILRGFKMELLALVNKLKLVAEQL
jgi:uncharacterized membrane protein YqiK